MNMPPTPHNAAKKEEIAKTVIMPGDPKRSKWIAETFLKDAKLVNDIRGIQGYTGSYNGKSVTVMASGMGISSIGIYAYELYNFYDTELIIRTGTAGSIRQDVKVNDIIIADGAFTDSGFLEKLGYEGGYIKNPSGNVLEQMKGFCEGHKVHTGAVLTEELYYGQEDIVDFWKEKQVLAFEMETACLFAYAKQADKQAGAIFTVSNNILTGEEMDPRIREKALGEMVEIALECAV